MVHLETSLRQLFADKLVNSHVLRRHAPQMLVKMVGLHEKTDHEACHPHPAQREQQAVVEEVR